MRDSDRVIGLYQRHSLAWDTDRHNSRFVEKGWLDQFISLLPGYGRVLDIGCGGSEPIAAYLARHGLAVTGIDTSPTMISLCHQRQPEQEWIVQDMRTLALCRLFDGIVAWDSFFHLRHEEQRRMFPIFQAHALPGAPLMFSTGHSHGEAIGSYQGEPLYHASLDATEYRSLLGESGFSVLAHVKEDAACGGRTVWLAQRRRDG